MKDVARLVTAVAGLESNKRHKARNETKMWSKYVADHLDASSLKSE